MKLLLVTACLLVLQSIAGKEDRNIQPFQWLEGSWSMKVKRGTITESWKMNGDQSLAGNSKMTSLSGEERVLENLELVFSEGTYYYVSTVNGQNDNKAVRFKITSYSEKGFVAENPEHDFPRRITYRRITDDSVHAFIDGGPQLPDKKSDFYYSRIKN